MISKLIKVHWQIDYRLPRVQRAIQQTSLPPRVPISEQVNRIGPNLSTKPTNYALCPMVLIHGLGTGKLVICVIGTHWAEYAQSMQASLP